MTRTPQQHRSRISPAADNPRGNLSKAYELFGDRLQVIIADMNRVLTA